MLISDGCESGCFFSGVGTVRDRHVRQSPPLLVDTEYSPARGRLLDHQPILFVFTEVERAPTGPFMTSIKDERGMRVPLPTNTISAESNQCRGKGRNRYHDSMFLECEEITSLEIVFGSIGACRNCRRNPAYLDAGHACCMNRGWTGVCWLQGSRDEILSRGRGGGPGMRRGSG